MARAAKTVGAPSIVVQPQSEYEHGTTGVYHGRLVDYYRSYAEEGGLSMAVVVSQWRRLDVRGDVPTHGAYYDGVLYWSGGER